MGFLHRNRRHHRCSTWNAGHRCGRCRHRRLARSKTLRNKKKLPQVAPFAIHADVSRAVDNQRMVAEALHAAVNSIMVSTIPELAVNSDPLKRPPWSGVESWQSISMDCFFD